MESPASWNRIEAAIAIAGLGPRTWDFLVDAGLVANRPDVREVFLSAVAEVEAQGEITGPSRARRIAGRVAGAVSAVTFTARTPDPNGERAQSDYTDFLTRGGPARPLIEPLLDEVCCQHCGTRTSIRPADVRTCSACGAEPLDVLALAVQLGHASITVRACPACLRANTFTGKHCYYCAHLF